MQGRFVVLVAVVGALSVAVASSPPASAGRFTMKGTVTSVVDGDTLDVRLLSGKRERVRLIGIDTPERAACYASQATAAARRLAQGGRVTLKGDPTQDMRDRYSRLLAYVSLPKGRDLGFQLIRGGYAKVYVYDRPFQRLSAYRNAESAARGLARSVWTCGRREAPAPPPAAPNCDPSYPDFCIPPPPPDLDCADVGRAFTVRGSDPHRFDREGDGVGCESYG